MAIDHLVHLHHDDDGPTPKPAVEGVGGDRQVGVKGTSPSVGVVGLSGTGIGVMGLSTHRDASGILSAGVLGGTYSNAPGVRGISYHEGPAGWFEGNVGIEGRLNVNGLLSLGANAAIQGQLNVNGDIITLGDVQLVGKDVAERFVVEGGEAAPGTLMIATGPDCVKASDVPYDPRVAGVISGAHDLRPGVLLGSLDDGQRRQPLALSGQVWCYVDADWGAIEVGDMLTTSSRPGHAMRAADPSRAFGAVVGKALAPISTGQRLIPILVALH